MKHLIPLAVLAAVAGPAFAGEAAMTRAIEAASLHDGAVDLVAYYQPATDGTLEVTATYAAQDGGAPARLVMALADGDAVQFALPGHRETLYSFVRSGDRVTVTAAPVASAKVEAKL